MAPFLLACILLGFHPIVAQPSAGPQGPGPHPWQVVPGERVGLDSKKLTAAAEAYRNVGTPFCLSVVKDGEMVLDTDYGWGKTHKIESMSAGKTMTAAMIGAALHQGLFDLDTPLAQYGVVPHANWSRNGIDWWPNVTVRHLITQSTGRGYEQPGTALTYDSDSYIQHLSFLLNTTAPGDHTARQWATKNFAMPLGIPHLYAFEDADPAEVGDTPILGKTQVSAGGDQPIACNDIARVGQLLLNKGVWKSADGTAERMLSEEYAQGFFTPQNPSFPYSKCSGHLCQQYSYLSYVSTTTDAEIPNNASCTLKTEGLVQVPGLPKGSLLAMGYLGKYMIVVPEEKLVVVAFGSNVAHLECPEGGMGAWATDESLVVSQIWAAIRNATLPSKEVDKAAAFGLQDERPSASPSEFGPHFPPPHKPVGPPPRPPPGSNPHNPHVPVGPQKPGAGACYCYCPGGQAIGRCKDNVASAADCTALSSASDNGVPDFCPKATMFYDCHDSQVDCPATLYTHMALRSNMSCSGPSNSSRPLMKAQQCHYEPVTYQKCYFLGNETCEHNPFFPSPHHPAIPSSTPQMFVI